MVSFPFLSCFLWSVQKSDRTNLSLFGIKPIVALPTIALRLGSKKFFVEPTFKKVKLSLLTTIELVSATSYIYAYDDLIATEPNGFSSR